MKKSDDDVRVTPATPTVTPQPTDFVGRDEPDPEDDDWACLTPTHDKFGNKLSIPAGAEWLNSTGYKTRN